MTLYHGFDASVPPSNPVPTCQVACGYLGGFTPHIWTLDEWNHANAEGHLRSLGIWVTDFNISPKANADGAIHAALSLGWKAHLTPLRYIAIDSETSEDNHFIADIGDSLLQAGFLGLDYRSVDAIMAAPSGLDEWVAHYNVPPGPFTPKVVGFQYQANVPFEKTRVDLDVFDADAYAHFGRGPRRRVNV